MQFYTIDSFTRYSKQNYTSLQLKFYSSQHIYLFLCLPLRKEIHHMSLLPVYSHASLDQNIKVLQASYQAGLRRYEFTKRHDNAIDIFKKLIDLRNHSMPDMQIGAGTMMNVPDAETFIEAGADFLVSPLISQSLLDFTIAHHIEWLPGCATGAEIGMAQNAGIPMVKLYPIKTLGGAEFLHLIKGPFYKMKFQVSGGIKGEIEEIKSLLKAGASVVGLGNSFFKEDVVEEEITTRLSNLLNQI
jgi:2-dehydro-3-deoxyphosphogluconate aldolase/(4S)-4-hydroxy-2-oxoglutarate aldolase